MDSGSLQSALRWSAVLFSSDRLTAAALNARVQDCAINVWMFSRQILHDARDLVQVGYIEDRGIDLVTTMPLDESVKILLAAAGNDDLVSLTDQSFGQGLSNSY